jgi:hypothetical protein
MKKCENLWARNMLNLHIWFLEHKLLKILLIKLCRYVEHENALFILGAYAPLSKNKTNFKISKKLRKKFTYTYLHIICAHTQFFSTSTWSTQNQHLQQEKAFSHPMVRPLYKPCFAFLTWMCVYISSFTTPIRSLQAAKLHIRHTSGDMASSPGP